MKEAEQNLERDVALAPARNAISALRQYHVNW